MGKVLHIFRIKGNIELFNKKVYVLIREMTTIKHTTHYKSYQCNEEVSKGKIIRNFK